MRKLLAMICLALMALLLVVGCGQKEEPQTQTPTHEEPAVEQAPELSDSAAVQDTTEVPVETTEEAGH